MSSHENETGTADDGDFTPPSKRPRMMSKACETCKQKKTKCDSSRPNCGTCRRMGATCIYKEKGQPGLRPGYGKAIEQRLSILESNMDKINQSVQDVLNHVRSDFTANSTTLQTPDPDVTPVTRTTNDQTLWQPSQPLPSMGSFTSSPIVDRLPPPSLQIPSSLNTVENGLPSEDILQELIDLFFELVYPWAPLFCKSNFMANIFSPERQILLHGIVVVCFRFWRKSVPSAQDREAWIKTSREQVLLRTIDECSLISTQALALLAIDTIGQGPGPRTWNVMSMLVAAARHLTLAKAPSPPTPETDTPLVRNEDPNEELDMSIIETEEKRRLFWVMYALDRFSSVSHGQSGGIDTKSIKLPYPSHDDDWGQNVNPEWFQPPPPVKQVHCHYPPNLWHHNIDVLALLDSSNQLLIQPVNLSLPAHCQEWQSVFRRLDITMATWFENLPRDVRETPATFDPMWVMLHATFHLISIRMYTVAAFPSTTSPYLRPSSAARGLCRQAIRNVVLLVTSLQPQELDQLSPMFAFVVWVASRSLIILWTTGYENTYGSMPTDLEPLLNGLRQIAIRWPCAQRYVDIIQLILDTKNSPGGSMGLDIFNDTRRTSYGLTNLLGTLAAHRAPEAFQTSFDFLDMPVFDMGEMATSRVGNFGSEMDGDWL